MFEILASAPEDGWAFVRRGEQIQLVRPPFQRWNLTIVPKSALETAIQHYGFAADRRTFPDWRSLIGYLKEQIVQSRTGQGKATPDPEAIRDLVLRAPPRILVGYLDRIEAELLPNQELKAAFEILTHLLEAEPVRSDQELRHRALTLLSRCGPDREKDARLQLIDEKGSWGRRFPLISRKFGAENVLALSRVVWQSHQILKPA